MDSPFTDVTNRLDFSSGRLSNRKPAKRVRKSVSVATSKTKRSCRRSDFMVPGDLTAQSSIHNPTQQIPTIPLDVTTRLDIPSGPVTYKEPARRVGKTDTAVTSKTRRSRRRADFTVSGELNAQSSIHNPTQHMPTIPSEYADFGEINCCCQHCGAQFWFAERAEKSTNATHPKFPVCCINGKISLPFFQQPPELLSNLFSGNDPRSRNFLDHIRTYNSMFAFTSLGGKVDGNMNNGGGPPQFVISSQNYHRIGSLLPNEGDVPKFAQLYIYDTQNEVANRMTHFGRSSIVLLYTTRKSKGRIATGCKSDNLG
ncbi:uncharacterized protein LOC130749458 isoform X1 [Lotus japonicus]|uniref:uncharacterized protein LOC130749458 isoform X1 n=1 Tax=Lotus japonicus TaxID=34305 RepID=UPI0025861B0C|nr:uncharacterized protein LOC130749458 isoform X1 [Lotus japonicus]XP_057458803.1 uncharacterized protein LOC130749458 isoform X1 [Lotus japonicus]XP_057458804.1 uncharacterized protein LOC130749458 isoform X1 [Lotus japonicus]XP_057458805.1 uncharacterized protein LOC130749458 isoform X1 [Lotus japonicus]XP_057458806.1 uncharacterized protein LOC130749458 isoform X1 [Lotus japonicus]